MIAVFEGDEELIRAVDVVERDTPISNCAESNGAGIFRPGHVQAGDLDFGKRGVQTGPIAGERRAHGNGGPDARVCQRAFLAAGRDEGFTGNGQRGERSEGVSGYANSLHVHALFKR